MVIVRLETSEGQFVANVEVAPFITPPDVLGWGNRVFKFESNKPATYRECFMVYSLTSGERAAELSAI